MRGFTLIELSIVLIIIGLIVGGVVGGKSLIRTATLNALVRDLEQMKVAVSAFELRYDALPGDMENSVEYWASAIGSGNGDDNITCCANVMGRGWEGLWVWNHLSLAGILPGNYEYSNVGIQGVGVNVPEFAIDGVGATIHDNSFHVGRETGMWALDEGFLPPLDVMFIDKKFDDGSPDTGIVTRLWSGENCINKTAPRAYIVTESENVCTFMYSMSM